MANRFLTGGMLRAINDFRDDNPECVTRNLLPGKVPGIWLVFQSQFPHPKFEAVGAPVMCEFEIKPGNHAFTGRAELLVKGTFNLDHMVVVLGHFTDEWKKGASSPIASHTPDWIGLQYDLTTRTGVVIMYRSLWDIAWGETEQKLK